MRKNPAKRLASCDEVIAQIEAVRAHLKDGCTEEEQAGDPRRDREAFQPALTGVPVGRVLRRA